MRKPSTTFNWVDLSGQLASDTQVLEVRPLFLAASSFDKGPEDMRRVYGDNFYKLYGQDISYVRHGQPAVQIANIIDAGGEVLIKRIVAPDATLANLIVIATATQARTAKVDPVSGQQIYIDADTGLETTSPVSASGIANEKAYINTATVKYSVSNVTDAKTMNDVIVQARTLIVEKDAGQVDGAGDPSTWIIYDGVLEDNATAPNKPLMDASDSHIGEGEIGTMPIADGEDDGLPYEPGTILEDDNLNVFMVTEDNKLELLGNAAAEYTYPLMVVCDNGRGVSSKRFNITCDYDVSKNAGFAMYKLNYLGTANYDAEYARFSCNPDVIYLDNSMSLTMTAKDLVQLQAAMIDDAAAKFINRISVMTGIEADEIKALDPYFGYNLKGKKISQITVDPEGYQLQSEYGMLLQGGSNGVFGEAPYGTEEWTNQLVEFFDGTFDDTIFDQDANKIEVCLDANYPIEVKNAIANLVTFREDFYFFRDYGLGNDNFDAVEMVNNSMTIKNKFIADYCTTYDVIDKFTKKQITVTIMYSLARILVNHLNNTRNCPFCGILYNVTIPEAIEGTVNFIPKVTPAVDQKTDLVDMHVNYAVPINGTLTVETQFTSQERETQCSHINNILTVQNTMRDIRTLCPRIRGSFIDQNDGLDKYAQQVKNVIDKHREEYESIEFTWSADDVQVANKIFNAALVVAFKNYVIAEIFTIYTVD